MIAVPPAREKSIAHEHRRVVLDRRYDAADWPSPEQFVIVSTLGEELEVTREEFYAIRAGDIFPSLDWPPITLVEFIASIPQPGVAV